MIISFNNGTLDLNGHRIDGVLNFSAGDIIMLKHLNMNGNIIKNASNLRYTINRTFDKNNNNERNRQIYVTFDKLTFFTFTTKCIIRDYMFIIQKTETDNVYEQHDIIFTAKNTI